MGGQPLQAFVCGPGHVCLRATRSWSQSQEASKTAARKQKPEQAFCRLLVLSGASGY